MRSQRCKLSIAIDGPAGAGKSTVARAVAARLGYTYVDTGAMYRAAALKCLKNGVQLDDHEAVYEAVHGSEISLSPGEDGVRVFLDGEDVSKAIRSTEVGEAVSMVAQVPQVRQWLVELQQVMGQAGGVVMDGRDIGTVVLPHAEVKVFLTASAHERARRRHLELLQEGKDVPFDEVLAAIERRDALDQSRVHSPLRKADDAVEIDTTQKTFDQVLEHILTLWRQKGGSPCSM